MNNLSLDRHWFLLVTIVIAAVVSICMQLMLPTIARNMEHSYKYNRAIDELEELSFDGLEEVQRRFLVNRIYKGTLYGTATAKHTKRAAKAIPWLFRLLADASLAFMGFLFLTAVGGQALQAGLAAILILAFVDPFCGYLLNKLLGVIYRNETATWEEEFQRYAKRASQP